MTDNPHQSQKPLIAAIIPTYNEELNVCGVLDVVRAMRILDEIILVDDGSSDNTLDILLQAAESDRRIKVIQHDRNRGKGQAIFSGWAGTTAAIILLLDADLKNLTTDHVHALLKPVIEHRADMTLGLFRGGHFGTDLSHWLTPFLTGQRAVRAELFKHISTEASKGYGFEIALTVAARQHNFRTRVIPLKGVWHPSSEYRAERGGYWNGKIWRFRMYGQIIRAFAIATRERMPPKAKAFFSEISKY